jgi:hypothetical protein
MNQFMRSLVLLLFISAVNTWCQDYSGTPVVFHSSLTGLAGDVLYLQGSGFGVSPRVEYAFNDANWTAITPLTSGNSAVTLQLPINQTRLPDLVTIRISADGTNWSSPIFVNQAKAYSFDTNQVGPGNSFRIFGRNLIFSRTPTVRLVDMADGSSHVGSVNTNASTSYALTAIAPSDILANHTYSVYVSNGYNGNAGSGSETVAQGTLQGRTAGTDHFNLGVPWAADINFAGNVYNVQNDPRLSEHARGDGSAGDMGAIGAAISAASRAGGGVVYLPAGTYNLYYSNGCGISLLPRVVLAGQGAGNTFVNFGFGPAPSIGTGYGLCFATSQTGVSDITFTNVNESGNWPESALGQGANEIFIQRTNWNISSAQWLVLCQTTNVTVQNSSIVQGNDPSHNGPINAAYSTNWVFRNNIVQYVGGAVEFDGVHGAVLEGNTIIRDTSVSLPVGDITHVIVGNFTRDFMLLQNSFQVTGGTLPRRNDGEIVNSEGGGAIRFDEFRGNVSYGGLNAVTDNSQNFNWSPNNAVPNLRVGAILAIVAGKGAGQWAAVTNVSTDGHIVWVDTPWAVVPDSTSRYATFDWSSYNWIIAGNRMSDNEKGIEFFDASIRDILITNNTFTNDGEILVSPTEQPDGAGLFNLVLNLQITGNTMIDTNRLRPAAISLVPREDHENSNFGTAFIGAELRGNTISAYTPNTLITDTTYDDSKALTEGLNLYWQWQTLGNFHDDGTPSLLATIVQGNTLIASQTGVYLDSGDYQTVLASNAYHNVDNNKVDEGILGADHASFDSATVTSAPSPFPTPAPASSVTPVVLPLPTTTSGTPVVSTVVSTPLPQPTAPALPAAAPAPLTPPRIGVHSPLVSGWHAMTVGSQPAAKLASELVTDTNFELSPSVAQFGGTSDSFSMLARYKSNNTELMAQITVPANASSAESGAVTFRADSTSSSAFVSVGLLQTGEYFALWRYASGEIATGWRIRVSQPGTPLWVRLGKSGDLFRTAYSLDGVRWSDWTTINCQIGRDNYLVGLAGGSNITSGPAVSFANVSLP